MYNERLLDHFQNPRNVGELAPPAVTVRVENPACGDLLHLSARWEAGRVAEARYRIRGCTASIAAGSALTEWLAGRTTTELSALQAGTVAEWLGGLPNASQHVGTLCVDGVKALLRAAPPVGTLGLD